MKKANESIKKDVKKQKEMISNLKKGVKKRQKGDKK